MPMVLAADEGGHSGVHLVQRQSLVGLPTAVYLRPKVSLAMGSGLGSGCLVVRPLTYE